MPYKFSLFFLVAALVISIANLFLFFTSHQNKVLSSSVAQITVHRLILTDSQGRKRGEMGIDSKGNAFFNFYYDDASLAINIVVPGKGSPPMISVFSPSHTPLLTFLPSKDKSTSEEGAILTLFTPKAYCQLGVSSVIPLAFLELSLRGQKKELSYLNLIAGKEGSMFTTEQFTFVPKGKEKKPVIELKDRWGNIKVRIDEEGVKTF